MLKEYEINEETLLLEPKGENKTRVLEKNHEYIVEKTPYEVMDHSCSYFGSSMAGRKEGSKKILGSGYKIPIIVEESRDIIFFPTASPTIDECIWISLNNIKDCFPHEAGEKTRIVFENNDEKIVKMNFLSFKNQLFRSTRLESILRKRKN